MLTFGLLNHMFFATSAPGLCIKFEVGGWRGRSLFARKPVVVQQGVFIWPWVKIQIVPLVNIPIPTILDMLGGAPIGTIGFDPHLLYL